MRARHQACVYLTVVLLLISCAAGAAGNTNSDLLTKPWSAKWIAPPKFSPFEFGVYHFRKTFDLAAKPARSLFTSPAIIVTSFTSTACASCGGRRGAT